jgi:hypothetical protein
MLFTASAAILLAGGGDLGWAQHKQPFQQLADAGVPVLLAQQLTGTVEPKQGTTLHVATTGSDAAGTGSAEAPYATPQKAVDLAQPGDTVYVHAGFYRGNIDFPRSGRADARISLVGEQGAVLDGSILIKDWELDPVMGASGVYRRRTAELPFPPFNMTWNNKAIIRLSSTQQNLDTQEEYFAKLMLPPQDRAWDGVEAVFGAREGYAYVRFRNKENPNTENVNFASNAYLFGSGVVNITGKSFITVRGFTIQCGSAGVIIRQGASDIIVENNTIMHGQKAVFVNGYAEPQPVPCPRIIVRNNRLTLAYVADLSPRNPRHGHIWNHFKEWGDMDRHGIYFYYAGDDCEAYGNDIFQHWDGIQDSAGGKTPDEYATFARRLKVHHNSFREMGDDAMEPTGGEIDAEWHDNVSVDALINVRIKEVKTGPFYFYRNRMSGSSRDIYYFAGMTAPAFLYHNTFATRTGVVMGSTKPEVGAPNTWFINNIFSNAQLYRPNARFNFNAHAHYNWVGEEPGKYAWLAADNIFAPGKRLWDTDFPDFLLKEDSPAREKGIDLSKPVTLDGQTFGPFPGMKPGYFKGARPDLGAVQYGETPEAVPAATKP